MLLRLLFLLNDIEIAALRNILLKETLDFKDVITITSLYIV